MCLTHTKSSKVTLKNLIIHFLYGAAVAGLSSFFMIHKNSGKILEGIGGAITGVVGYLGTCARLKHKIKKYALLRAAVGAFYGSYISAW